MAHGIRNLHQHNNGIYYAVFKRDGKQHWRTLDTRSLKQARAKLRQERKRFFGPLEGEKSVPSPSTNVAQLEQTLAEVMAELARLREQVGVRVVGVPPPSAALEYAQKDKGGPSPTHIMDFPTAVERHFSTMTFASKKTKAMYLCQRNLVKRLCLKWNDFVPATLWNRAREGKGRRRKTGDSSQNHFRLYLCKFAEWCTGKGLLDEQLIKDARSIVRLTVNPRKPVIPSPEAMAVLLAQVEQEDKKLGRFCQFLAFTAARVGSALAAKWSEIDWAQGKIKLHLKGATEKEIFLHPRAVELLREMQRDGIAETSGKCIFSLDDSDVRRTRTLLRKWAAALDIQINIPHLLRHYHASRLVMQNMDMASVSAQLGHNNIATTMKAYIHVVPSHVQSQLNTTIL